MGIDKKHLFQTLPISTNLDFLGQKNHHFEVIFFFYLSIAFNRYPANTMYFCQENIAQFLHLLLIFKHTSDYIYHGSKHYEP